VPYLFVYGPSLLMQGTVGTILWSSLTALVGVFSLTAALQGWLLGRANLLERALLAGAAFSLIKTGIWTDTIGFVLFAAAVAWQLRYRRNS
jgi:TRAP-type uncharacterized transport system fused permease subunit